MNQRIIKQQHKNLHDLFRSQIVQNYPPQNQYQKQIFMEQEISSDQQPDLMDLLISENQIVEEYVQNQQAPKRRGMMNFGQVMLHEEQNNEVNSRNSSLSSKENNIDFHNRSFDRISYGKKKFSDDCMDIESPIGEKENFLNFSICQKTPDLSVLTRQKQKTQKIQKLQQVGCNCRKSKCLKMYCECFHLQIFCSQNCNCVGCGNAEPNQGHQQAVIDALTRNPKAFEEQKPSTGFTLGVQLAQVKKGCKCKKTKCLKKYCQCYNSGDKCGKFCKCEGCQNC